MKTISIGIEGYKCFKEKVSFGLKNITLLTGANSAGKSSVIQSLLLLREVYDARDSIDDTEVNIGINNDRYALELGRYDDIVNHENQYDFLTKESQNIIFELEGGAATVKAADNVDSNKSIKVNTEKPLIEQLDKLFAEDFVYLNADRMAPHYEYKNSDYDDYCDCHGGNTGNVILKHENDKCSKERAYTNSDRNKWKIELDKWIDFIFPGTALQIVRSNTTSDYYQVKVLGSAATNVGFGITYALPVLVSGLTVPAGGMLIVENPEAHLHAKAQSNMGYFLARMAAAGVRVILETHSEHIVNGIRRMIVEGKTGMSHDDMTIYFFRNKDGKKNIMEFGMDEWGDLDEFPVDFFDQVRQDMLELMEIGRKRVEHNEG